MIIDTSKDLIVKYHHEDKVKMSQSGARAMKYYIEYKTLLQAESLQNFPIWDGNLGHTVATIVVNCQFGNPATTTTQILERSGIKMKRLSFESPCLSGREDLQRPPCEETSTYLNERLSFESPCLSGREDLNLRPLAPHASALAGLRHAPMAGQHYSPV